jgi:hypothetical protein
MAQHPTAKDLSEERGLLNFEMNLALGIQSFGKKYKLIAATASATPMPIRSFGFLFIFDI